MRHHSLVKVSDKRRTNQILCSTRLKRVLRFVALTTMFLAVALADEPTVAAAEALDGQTAATPPKAENPKPAEAAPSDPKKLHVDLYPLFGWLPFFSSNFKVPPLPNGGGGGESIGGSTNVKISGIVAFAVDAIYEKWLIEGNGMFANVSGSHTLPNASVSTHLDFGDLFIGRDVWKGLYALAGFRRIALDFSANALDSPTFNRKPGLWDPLIGAEYRKQLRHKINVQGRFDGGGFGVGSAVDIDAQVRLEWRFVRHFGTVIGYQVLYEKLTGTVTQPVLNRTITYPWQYAQTFHGPVVGFGIYF